VARDVGFSGGFAPSWGVVMLAAGLGVCGLVRGDVGVLVGGVRFEFASGLAARVGLVAVPSVGVGVHLAAEVLSWC
jgi:hypothetical protein